MTEPSMAVKELYSKAEFCSTFGVGHTRFYALLNAGDLKAVKIGRRTFVERDEALRWKRTLAPYTPQLPRG